MDIDESQWIFDKKKCPNNKKEIYNDKYRHTRDILFGLGIYVIERIN
jgi:hypothetical protein